MSDFYKYHGLGNDYIVIDPNKARFPINMTQKNIRLICNRNLGVGSDGILFGPIIENGEIAFRIFNPDGSEAEKSGNGIRIFAQYIWDQKYENKSEISLITKGGRVTVKKIDESQKLLQVNMGQFSFSSEIIPVNGNKRDVINEKLHILDTEFHITCVTIGNPHCVIICNDISAGFAKKYGPVIEKNILFPNKTNVQFVKIADRKNIEIQIWERGAGYTLASGSSSVAAVCASYKNGLVDRDVTVHMPGGKAGIKIEGINAFLTATVSSVMQGKIAEDLKLQLLRE